MRQHENSLLTAVFWLCRDPNTTNASAHEAVVTVGGLLTALTFGTLIRLTASKSHSELRRNQILTELNDKGTTRACARARSHTHTHTHTHTQTDNSRNIGGSGVAKPCSAMSLF
jgi:hypothetical protein